MIFSKTFMHHTALDLICSNKLPFDGRLHSRHSRTRVMTHCWLLSWRRQSLMVRDILHHALTLLESVRIPKCWEPPARFTWCCKANESQTKDMFALPEYLSINHVEYGWIWPAWGQGTKGPANFVHHWIGGIAAGIQATGLCCDRQL